MEAEAGPEAEVKAGPEAEVKAGPEAEAEAGPEAEAEAGPEAEAEAGPEAEAEADPAPAAAPAVHPMQVAFNHAIMWLTSKDTDDKFSNDEQCVRTTAALLVNSRIVQADGTVRTGEIISLGHEQLLLAGRGAGLKITLETIDKLKIFALLRSPLDGIAGHLHEVAVSRHINMPVKAMRDLAVLFAERWTHQWTTLFLAMSSIAKADFRIIWDERLAIVARILNLIQADSCNQFNKSLNYFAIKQWKLIEPSERKLAEAKVKAGPEAEAEAGPEAEAEAGPEAEAEAGPEAEAEAVEKLVQQRKNEFMRKLRGPFSIPVKKLQDQVRHLELVEEKADGTMTAVEKDVQFMRNKINHGDYVIKHDASYAVFKFNYDPAVGDYTLSCLSSTLDGWAKSLLLVFAKVLLRRLSKWPTRF